MTEDEKAGWDHRLNGHEFVQIPGDGDGQGSLACCSPWDCRAGHDSVTEQQQVVLVVKNQPAKAGDSREEVQSLGREGPLE